MEQSNIAQLRQSVRSMYIDGKLRSLIVENMLATDATRNEIIKKVYGLVQEVIGQRSKREKASLCRQYFVQIGIDPNTASVLYRAHS